MPPMRFGVIFYDKSSKISSVEYSFGAFEKFGYPIRIWFPADNAEITLDNRERLPKISLIP
jgi:hypothetical protein